MVNKKDFKGTEEIVQLGLSINGYRLMNNLKKIIYKNRKTSVAWGWVGAVSPFKQLFGKNFDSVSNGRMDGRMDGRTDGWTDGRTGGRTVICGIACRCLGRKN